MTPIKPDSIDTARENLRAIVAVRQTTPTAVSRAAGLSVNTLGSFMRGESQITYSNLLKCAARLAVPIGVLHRQDGATRDRIRLQQLTDRISADQAPRAIEALQQILS